MPLEEFQVKADISAVAADQILELCNSEKFLLLTSLVLLHLGYSGKSQLKVAVKVHTRDINNFGHAKEVAKQLYELNENWERLNARQKGRIHKNGFEQQENPSERRLSSNN